MKTCRSCLNYCECYLSTSANPCNDTHSMLSPERSQPSKPEDLSCCAQDRVHESLTFPCAISTEADPKIRRLEHVNNNENNLQDFTKKVNLVSLGSTGNSRRPAQFAKPKLGTYVIERTIGKGIFSSVKLATHTITGLLVAIKIIDKTRLKPENLRKVYRESEILKVLQHTRIVKLFQIMETPRLLCVVMEYIPNGEIFDYIATHGRFCESEARAKFLDILSAVDYTHSCGFVHRDLKAENLLLDEDMNVKVIDFSFGTFFDSTRSSLLTTWCGSPPYAAPEIFLGEPYSGVKADIWSLGVVLYVMVCGALPFDAHSLPLLKNQVLSACFRVPYWLSISCEKLIRSMLTKDPNKRPTTSEIFQHSWLRTELPVHSSESSLLSSNSTSLTSSATTHSEMPNSGHIVQRSNLLNSSSSFSLSSPSPNLAAEMRIGVLNDFIILIMESYGMARVKILESLRRCAYDHLTATYLLLGEKLRRSHIDLPSSFMHHLSCTHSLSPCSFVNHEDTVCGISGCCFMDEVNNSATTNTVADSTNTNQRISVHPITYPPTCPYEYLPKNSGHNDIELGYVQKPLTNTEFGLESGQLIINLPMQTGVKSRENNDELFINKSNDIIVASVEKRDNNEQNVSPIPFMNFATTQAIPLLNSHSSSSSTTVGNSPPRILTHRKYGISNPPDYLGELAQFALLAQQNRNVSENFDDDDDV